MGHRVTGWADARLATKQEICAFLGDISPGTYDSWQAKGLVPGPLPGTTRYDRRVHEHYLDRIGGIKDEPNNPKTALELWEESQNAR